MLLALLLIVGCGDRAEKKMQGVSEKRNYVAQGMKYLAQSDIQRAIKSFDQAIKQDPTNSNNYVVLGQVYIRLNNLESAIDSLSAAVRVDPNNGEAGSWTNTSSKFRKIICFMQTNNCILPIARINKIIPIRNNISNRTSFLTKRNTTIHASGPL